MQIWTMKFVLRSKEIDVSNDKLSCRIKWKKKIVYDIHIINKEMCEISINVSLFKYFRNECLQFF